LQWRSKILSIAGRVFIVGNHQYHSALEDKDQQGAGISLIGIILLDRFLLQFKNWNKSNGAPMSLRLIKL
jgi:hypothetical protein